jgi:hypothetical protein
MLALFPLCLSSAFSQDGRYTFRAGSTSGNDSPRTIQLIILHFAAGSEMGKREHDEYGYAMSHTAIADRLNAEFEAAGLSYRITRNQVAYAEGEALAKLRADPRAAAALRLCSFECSDEYITGDCSRNVNTEKE